jgi:acyl-CoA dehydrogenase
MFNQGITKGMGLIRFHDYRKTYDTISLPNVDVFKEQIQVFNEFMAEATPDEKQGEDLDFILNAGELFTLVVYGQLIIENAEKHDIGDALLDQIFDFIVRDFSLYALKLHSKPSSTEKQQEILLRCIRKPNIDEDRFGKVWEEVHSLKDLYEMKQ